MRITGQDLGIDVCRVIIGTHNDVCFKSLYIPLPSVLFYTKSERHSTNYDSSILSATHCIFGDIVFMVEG